MALRRCALAFLAVSGAGRHAAAHGGLPAASSVAPGPGTDRHLAVTTNFGVVLSRDRGATWHWVCEQALGVSEGGLNLAWTSAGTLVGASPDGLVISRDGGCSWRLHPLFKGKSVSEVLPARDGRVLFVATESFDSANGVWVSADSGESFEPVALAARDRASFSSVRAAPPDPQRLYVGAWSEEPLRAWLYRSDDGGSSWRQMPQKTPEVWSRFRVLGASPADPDTVFAFTGAVQNAAVVRSSDGGETFEPVLSVDEVRGLSFSPDGRTLWIADFDRVYRSVDTGRSFDKLPVPRRNGCVAGGAGEIYACGWPWEDTWAVGASRDGGETWRPLLNFADIKGPLDCPATTVTGDECRAAWPWQALELGIRNASDAGASDGRPIDTGGGCGCRLGAAAGTPSWALPLAFGLAAAGLATRRRRRGPRGG